jgi:hypothetical protein
MSEHESITVRDAFEHAPTLLVDKGIYINDIIHPLADKHNINISDILTYIIQTTGRFCERYASDIVYHLDSIRSILAENVPIKEPVIEVMGIRQSGVDGEQYLLNNLETYKDQPGRISDYYRQIIAVELKTVQEEEEDLHLTTIVTLKDITNDVKYHDEDKITK